MRIVFYFLTISTVLFLLYYAVSSNRTSDVRIRDNAHSEIDLSRERIPVYSGSNEANVSKISNDNNVGPVQAVQKRAIGVNLKLHPFQKPVVVRVSIYSSSGEILSEERFKIDSGVSDNVTYIDPSKQIACIIASASGYVPTKKNITAERNQSSFELEIFDCFALNVFVNSNKTDAVPGATVNILSKTNGIQSYQLITDETGKAVCPIKNAGTYFVTASHPKYSLDDPLSIDLQYNPVSVNLTLKNASGIVYGCVRDGKKSPLFGIEVILYRDDKITKVMTAKTDGEGKYSIQNVPLDDFYIGIDPGDEYIRSDVFFSNDSFGVKKKDRLFERVALTLENPVRMIDFETRRSLLVRGTVVSEEGSPIFNAIVLPAFQGGRNQKRTRPIRTPDIRTDVRGNFEIPIKERLEYFDELRVAGIHPKFKPSIVNIPIINWEEEINPITIILKNGTSKLKGKILDATTRLPVTHEIIMAKQVPFQFKSDFSLNAESDADGCFELMASFGEYQICMEEYVVLSPNNVCIEDESSNDLIVLAQKKNEGDAAIEGRVLSKDLEPINGAEIILVNAPFQYGDVVARASSVSDGSFKLSFREDSSKNSTKLKVQHPEFLTKEMTFNEVSDISNLEILLSEQPGTVKVVIERNDAESIFAHLISVNSNRIVKSLPFETSDAVYFHRVNPDRGPFFVLIGNPLYVGVSSFFDLSSIESKYKELNVLVKPRDRVASLHMRIVDSEQNIPIPAVKCTLKCMAVNDYGVPEAVEKIMLSDMDGMCSFNNLPMLIGNICYERAMYETKVVPFSIGGLQENDRMIEVLMHRFNN